MELTKKQKAGIVIGAAAIFSGLLYALKSEIRPTTGSVAGSVVDISTSLPITGVTVALNGLTITLSGANGEFHAGNIMKGNYILSLRKSYYQEISMSITIIAGQTINVGVLKMTPTIIQTLGDIMGTVVDDTTEAAILGALVTVTGTSRTFSALTNSVGVFFIADIPEGIYNGKVEATEYQTAYF